MHTVNYTHRLAGLRHTHNVVSIKIQSHFVQYDQ